MRRILNEHSQVASQALRDQWTRLVMQPLSRRGRTGTQGAFMFVIDALDECEDEQSIGTLLQLLPQVRELAGIRMRILVTSRPDTPVRHGFKRMDKHSHYDFVLHNISSDIVDKDIQVFLKYKFSEIALQCCFPDNWPGTQIIELMVNQTGGLFIWAETACRYVREGGARFAKRRLDVLMNHSSTDAVIVPEQQLDEIYTIILRASIPETYDKDEQELAYKHLKHVLGVIANLFSTISAAALSKLLNTSIVEIERVVEELHSILDIPENSAEPLRLHHDSFRNFLMDEKRCRDCRMFVSKEEAHAGMATRCIEVMSLVLREDICNQRAPGVLLCDVDESLIQRCLPQHARYACLYWIAHVVTSKQQLTDNGQVHRFLQEHALHWIEAMSWTGQCSEAIGAMASLDVMIKGKQICRELHALVYDAKRLLMYARSGLEKAPLQIYVIAACFAPAKSIMRIKHRRTTLLRSLITTPQVPETWGASLLTLEGHWAPIIDVQFSRDGNKLASASEDGTTRVWDGETGALLQTLEGHRDRVVSVQFSPDDSKLASASWDGSVRVWNAKTGSALHTLGDHREGVNSVQFSTAGDKLASASQDGTVRVWDVYTGAILQTLENHRDRVNCVQFSQDGSMLASASKDSTVQIWDANTGATLHTLEDHSDRVSNVQFSPDSKKLASASCDRTVRVWDTDSGVVLHTLKGHSGPVTSVQFSPDGSKLASASEDKTVRMWDGNTGATLQILMRHSDKVNCVQF